MLAESMKQTYRKLKTEEVRLIEYLAKIGSYKLGSNWDKEFRAASMNDGKMGGLRLIRGEFLEERKFRRCIAERNFKDLDGVVCVIALNVDSKNDLFELEIWKTDFTALLEMPSLNKLYVE